MVFSQPNQPGNPTAPEGMVVDAAGLPAKAVVPEPLAPRVQAPVVGLNPPLLNCVGWCGPAASN
ncbi:hypothetical protein AAF134_00705 [Synechococcus lacustris Tous-12m]